MASTPKPRSFNKIIGDMIDAFLSRFGIKQLKVGSPVLSILEAAAQSDLRQSQDVFNFLTNDDLDRQTGIQLDREAGSEDLTRETESPASGVVTISDSRFSKISSKVYQGKPAPIVGTATLYVTDASSFPTSGQLYIGRGTNNYEGPLTYTNAVNSGSFWTVTLDVGSETTKFHNTGESVVFAQGGNRTISAGSLVQTPQGNASDAVQFSTLYKATIPDGEVSVEGVFVIAKKPGVIGNVPKGAINAFVTAPFPGATVTNPGPYSNGKATESDSSLRERIKNKKASKSLGTGLAIKTSVLGITSDDDNKKVISASIVDREGYPTTLYVDDGTGYEERTSGIAIEPLNDSSLGGEKFFKLSVGRPVSKASVTTTAIAPFPLLASSKLALKVGGVLYEHSFTSTDFRAIENATAFEIASSVNANPGLGFNARTSDAGTTVTLFSKEDANEDIQVVAPASGTDANDILQFTTTRVDSLRLYKNDRLLSKDGKKAVIRGKSSSLWNALDPLGENLTVAIDGTPAVTYAFTGQDFIDAHTGFSTLSNNTPEAWALVFNNRIPGQTSTVDGGAVVMTSNIGATSRARLSITGGSLVSKQMFAISDESGADRDYTMNRNTGEIQLTTHLVAGDRLSAGSLNARAFLETPEITPVTFGATGNLWFSVDGSASIISTGITGANTFNITEEATGTWGGRYRIAAVTGTPFTNVQADDWLILWDTSVNVDLRGVWRITASTTTYIEFETLNLAAATGAGIALAQVGIQIVRSSAPIQKVAIPPAVNYTAESFAASINSQLKGATAQTYRTNRLRVFTNTFLLGGDIALVAADTQGLGVQLPVAAATENRDSHLASVESGSSDVGTPNFELLVVASNPSATDKVTWTGTAPAPSKFVAGAKNIRDAGVNRQGNNRSFRSLMEEVIAGAPNEIVTRESTLQGWVQQDRFFLASQFAISAEDEVTALVDNDSNSKRFTVPLWRALTPVGGSYGVTNTFKDKDNSGASLTGAFGLGYSFDDFTAYMKSRVKTHDADATKAILWRYKRFGPEGNAARVRYTFPSAPSSALAVTVDSLNAASPTQVSISVALPSDARKTNYGLRSTTRVGFGAYLGAMPLQAFTLCIGFAVSSATRAANVTTATLTLPSGLYAITDHNLQIGDQVWLQSSNVNFTSGLKTITARSATTISYADVAANIGPLANIGTISNDSTGETLFTGASPSPIVVGDLVRLEDATGIPAAWRGQTIRISSVGAQFIQGYAEKTFSGLINQSLTWSPIIDAAKIAIYSLLTASCTATAIKNSVNALDAKCPVTATLLGAGGGSILLSSREEALTADPWFQLVDGVNWVKTTTSPGTLAGDYQLTFKSAVNGGLVADADWANEEVRIVPQNVTTLSRWLSTPAVSGLFSVGTVVASSQARKLQLASSTPGSEGSIQIQGGSANTFVTPVVGSASADSSVTPTVAMVSIEASDSLGLHADQWVSLDNALPLPKAGIIDATTALTSIAADGTFTFSAGPALYTLLATLTNQNVDVTFHGNFVAIANGGHVTPREGDWVRIAPPSAGTPVISTVNQGIFRVVRVTADAVWIENTNAQEEQGVLCNIQFFSSGSLMPGDTISISSAIWGASNMGMWTISTVGDAGGGVFTNTATFKVSSAPTPQGAVAALGASEAKLIVVGEGKPTRLIKRIQSIVPNQSSTSLLDVKFDTGKLYNFIGASAGTVMTVLDKLNFPSTIAKGLDGYRRSIGLIGEATRVLYGDERDSATYPGVVAKGAQVNVSGPLVKRVVVAVAIRARLGVATTDIADKVKSAIASVINKAGIGQSIAISDIVGAAGKVNGVLAVTIISPLYGAGSDLISVQPFEKALVLNVDQDVLVSFVGE